MRKKIALAALAAIVVAAGTPSLVKYGIRRQAEKAGYVLHAGSVRVGLGSRENPLRVTMREVSLSGKGVTATADEVSVEVDGSLVPKSVSLSGAKLKIRKTEKGGRADEGGSVRPTVLVRDSEVMVETDSASLKAKVRSAKVNPDGRVWAEADAEVRTAGYTVSTDGLKVEGLKKGEKLKAKAKRVKIRQEKGKTGEGEGDIDGPAIAIEVEMWAEEIEVDTQKVRGTAKSVNLRVKRSDIADSAEISAGEARAMGVVAVDLRASVSRAKSGRTTLSASADSVDTEYDKLSDSEFSVKKVRMEASVRVGKSTIELDEAEVKIGGAKADIRASLSPSVFSTSVEMPEVGCQELLDSLPQELVPELRPKEGKRMTMDGTIQWRAEVQVDLPERKSPDVSIWMKNKCVVKDVPEALDVRTMKKPFSREVYRPDGSKRRETSGPGSAEWVPIGAVSPTMPLAVMAMEDPSFLSHRGIVIQAIENSMEQNISSGKFVRGGSTISMQLTKNLWLEREKTLSRKVQEAFLTTYLEQRMTKYQILEYYLNVVEFGPDLYGIGPASRKYFSKDPSDLTLSQSLFLASLLPNPKGASFSEGKQISGGRLSLIRRVMKMMLDRGTITGDQYERGLKETPVYGEPRPLGVEDAITGDQGISPSEWM